MANFRIGFDGRLTEDASLAAADRSMLAPRPLQPIFLHPIGTPERLLRKAVCAAMNSQRFRSYVVRAQGALFVVDPTDVIDRSIALDGIWEGEQLEYLASVSR